MNYPRKSPHPGRYIAEEMPELQLDKVTLAERLGISVDQLDSLINGCSDVTPTLAVKLAETIGSTPEMWMRLQQSYTASHS
ncbi:HigA family addiction module antitoxin [Tatumella ptyseos]|uniref:HigA family addiction module antitoxin n=1 Tax=Tatumella ptyseos TaxID=82987 RepID=UPI0026EBC65B|nr:HigA family addiction module antitoxin [Tatumella ptyseos]WKX27200.1 HigA family addiction module antitoxin [Tatumella ptyseos]